VVKFLIRLFAASWAPRGKPSESKAMGLCLEVTGKLSVIERPAGKNLKSLAKHQKQY
jgi:hypothetical protein